MNTILLKKKCIGSLDCDSLDDVWKYLHLLTPDSDPYYNTLELFYGIHLIYNDGALEHKSFRNRFVRLLIGEYKSSNCALVKLDENWNLLSFTEDDIYVLCRLMKL